MFLLVSVLVFVRTGLCSRAGGRDVAKKASYFQKNRCSGRNPHRLDWTESWMAGHGFGS